MSDVVVGRSPQEIVDDTHIEASNDLAKILNEMNCGRCLFVGGQRMALKDLKARVDDYILGEGPPVDWVFAKIYRCLAR